MIKNVIQIISILLISVPTMVWGQNDSVEIFKPNDNYIEIKTLRHALKFSAPLDTPMVGLTWGSLIPEPIKIKDGVVIIRDRQDNILKLFIYADSTMIQEEHVKGGKLYRQFNHYDKTNIEVQKYYWENGNLQGLVLYSNKKILIYNFTKDGKLIIEQDK